MRNGGNNVGAIGGRWGAMGECWGSDGGVMGDRLGEWNGGNGMGERDGGNGMGAIGCVAWDGMPFFPVALSLAFASSSPSLLPYSLILFLSSFLTPFLSSLSHPDSYYLSPPLVISHSLPLFLSSSLNLSHSSSLFLSSLTLLFSSLTFSLSSSLTLLSSSLTFSLSSSLFLSSICPSLSASLVVTPTFMARSKHHRLTPISCSNDSSSALPVPPPIMPLARIATSTCRLRACIPPPPNSLGQKRRP
ncbi:unnamed protein product [Closterium sp. NIES-65]|nr:unnamed protein product [Closterium sp. NIES-65]